METKSVQTLTTPDTLEDLQLILNNPSLYLGMNLINAGTDEYYVSYADWLSDADVNKKTYSWDADNYYLNDWRGMYKSAFMANTVLLNLEKINEVGRETVKNNIRGSALFIRAHCFYQIAQEFALQYDASSAETDMGIVLRLNADFNEESVRASVKQTYDQILLDLEEAVKLLPATTFYKFQPTKAAGLALLARVYLQIGNYEKARANADASLRISGDLIDYNTLTSSAVAPLGDYTRNPEILYYFTGAIAFNANAAKAKIDTLLYKTYDLNDTRRKVFFRSNTDGSVAFKGNYTGDASLFNGIAVDELYLIRAECNARSGNLKAAMDDLNALLVKRWATGKFVPLVAANPDEAILLILLERRKELLYRGIRWSDLKRLNKDPKFAISLKRNLNGVLYQLPPNDLRYAALIPLEVITATNLKQNLR